VRGLLLGILLKMRLNTPSLGRLTPQDPKGIKDPSTPASTLITRRSGVAWPLQPKAARESSPATKMNHPES